jgi:hypothetical protein
MLERNSSLVVILNWFAYEAKRPFSVCALPKRYGNRNGIDVDTRPPCRLIAVPVKLAVVEPTYRNRELIAHLTAQCTRLRKAKMMRIGGFAAAHDARLFGHKFAVVLVAQANRFTYREGAVGANFFGGT